MSTKPKILLCNNRKYYFQQFLKQYKQAIISTGAGQLLERKKTLQILDYLGYIAEQKTSKDYEIVNSIIYLLCFPKNSGYITQQNLFRFLMAVGNIHQNIDSYFEREVYGLPSDKEQSFQEPLVKIVLGSFDDKGKWNITEEQGHQIRDIFQNLTFNKIARNDIEAKKRESKAVRDSFKQEIFQPKILKKSRMLAQQHYLRFDPSEKNNRVQDRLLLSQTVHLNKIESITKQNMVQELNGCTFKPKINKMGQKENQFEDIYLKERQRSSSVKSVGSLLMLKGKQYEHKKRKYAEQNLKHRRQEQMKQCSFHPNTYKSAISYLRASICRTEATVKNEEKAISRLKQGRKSRQSVEQIKQRGYPKGVSWSRYIAGFKNGHTLQNQQMKRSTENENPILSIDLKIFNEKNMIHVYEGQKIEQLSEQICQRKKLPRECLTRINQLIKQSIVQCSDIVVKRNHVFAKKW